MSLTSDQLKHLGNVAAWLGSAPSLSVNYGEFYVRSVQVVFDGDPMGEFINHDDTWNFYAQGEPQPRLVGP